MNGHYSPELTKMTGVTLNPRPEITTAEWHEDAIGDTGTSHMRVSNVSVVECEWCEAYFVARTSREAMEMFRAHETDMLNQAHVEYMTRMKFPLDEDRVASTGEVMAIVDRIANENAELLRRLAEK